MPISPERQKRYPGGSLDSPEWQAIRAYIKARSGNRCEACGVPNGSLGYWEGDEFHVFPFPVVRGQIVEGHRVCRVILTVAHVDHDPGNNHETNHRHWCQKCHLKHDAPMRRAGRAGEDRLD